MVELSRRNFLGTGAAALTAVATRSASDQGMDEQQSGESPAEILSATDGPWTPARVIDTDKMAWEHDMTWQRKLLYNNDVSGSHLMLLYTPPGWTGGILHYHLFHEWVYVISGDLTNHDYSSVNQKVGYMQQFRQGDWLDRPAFGLHADEPGRLPSQIGCFLMIMEEGKVTLSPDKSSPWYSEDYKKVREWTMPRIVDTIGDMPWSDDGSVDGLKVKRLADDPARGFRANLFWLPAGWKSDQANEYARAYYREEALEFNFVLVGGMKIQPYRNPKTKAEPIELNRYSLFERGPKCIAGLVDGTVTQAGCIWLQVIYGNGKEAIVSDHPIGEQIRI